ncbi:MAG: hypothetical protein NTW16_14250 [Bacteroidetes bacterium]|nr:hypothetical protein [Bacteroidota bacterium]
MRYIRFMPIILLLLPILFSCNKTLTVNAPWEDVTVVYCLLDQNEDTTFIKITKAYLGEGDALQFAAIPDSSNYPDKLEVRLDEFSNGTLIQSYPCDTVTIRNKEKGDSIFYYPDQLMYYTNKAKLNENYTYKLYIKNKKSGKEITSQTELLHNFEVIRPQAIASFPPGKSFEIKWDPSKNGKRYQLLIRFFYQEALKTNTDSLYIKWVDWVVFNNVQPVDVSSTQAFDLFFPGDAFYSVVGASIPKDSLVTRVAYRCSYIFTVAATELNTYMEVTEPSMGLVQERPAFTNIVNGIGLFSARFTKSVDSLVISPITKNELKVNVNTKDLGF